MTKLLLGATLLCFTACSNQDREQTKDDAAKLGRDLKREAKKADEVVTKNLREAREKVQKGVEKTKDAAH